MDRISKWLVAECVKVYSDMGHYMKYEDYRSLRMTVLAPTTVRWEQQELIHKENRKENGNQ